MGKVAVLCLLFVALRSALTDETLVYFQTGGDVTLDLRPPSSGNIDIIVWTFNGDLLAEWVKKLIPLKLFSPFESHATLDTNTGSLSINNMNKSHVGVYTVEINNTVQSQTYRSVLLKALKKPVVWFIPLTCDFHSTECEVSCDTDITGAGPVTYSWRIGDGSWEESGKIMTVTQAAHARVKKFTCRIKNPLSEVESEATDNKLYQPDSTPVWVIVIVIIIIIIIIAVIVVAGIFLKKKYFNNRNTPANEAEPETVPFKETSSNSNGGS